MISARQRHVMRACFLLAAAWGFSLTSPQCLTAAAQEAPDTKTKGETDLASALLGLDLEEDEKHNVRIKAVRTGGPASKMKIEVGDAVIKLNDSSITDLPSASEALAAVRAGDRVQLTLVRSNRRVTLAVVAAEKPPTADYDVDAGKVDGGILGLFLVGVSEGKVTVSNVSPDSPAAQAGMRKGDVLITVEGHRVSSVEDLLEFTTKAASRKKPGDTVEIAAERKGKPKTFRVTLADSSGAQANGQEQTPPPKDPVVFCMALRQTGDGLAVVEAMEGSPAAVAGVQRGDVIAAVDGQPVASAAEFDQLIQAYQVGDAAEFTLHRGTDLATANVTIGPCEHELRPAVRPAAPAHGLDEVAGQIKALQGQVEELRSSLESLAATIDALRGK